MNGSEVSVVYTPFESLEGEMFDRISATLLIDPTCRNDDEFHLAFQTFLSSIRRMQKLIERKNSFDL